MIGFILLYRMTRSVHAPNSADPYYQSDAFVKPPDIAATQKASDFAEIAKRKFRIPIIMYHYVEFVADPTDAIRKKLDTVPTAFEHQLKSLKDAGYETFFIKDIPDIFSGKIQYNPKSVIITFDDGYEDFYTDAYPILKKYNMKATQFIIYNFINRPNYMKESQIRDLSHGGLIEIASHTLNHTGLKGLSEKAARKEIFDSKQMLEEKFGITVSTFAYPYGSFNAMAEQLVREAGYTAAVSVIPGIEQSEDNMFYLYRIRPGNFGMGDVVKMLENYKNK